MDLRAPLPVEFAARARVFRAQHEEGKEPAMDKDTPLTVPMGEWERSDREGTCGNGRRCFFVPCGRRYRERYDLIDWAK